MTKLLNYKMADVRVMYSVAQSYTSSGVAVMSVLLQRYGLTAIPCAIVFSKLSISRLDIKICAVARRVINRVKFAEIED